MYIHTLCVYVVCIYICIHTIVYRHSSEHLVLYRYRTWYRAIPYRIHFLGVNEQRLKRGTLT